MTNAELQIQTQSPSQWGRVLSIAVPRSRYDAVRATVLRDLRRQIARPGFRKGHVPTALVEREFGSRIENDTLEKFLPDVCEQAIETQALDVISQPRLKNLVLDDPEVVRVEVAFDVRPTITLGSLDGLRGTRYLASIKPADVTRTLDGIRDEHAQFVTVERAAQDGDFVQISYVPLDESGHEIAAKRVDNFPFQIGAGGSVPEFEAAVRGLAPGGAAPAAIQYPADYTDASMAGRTVAFQLTLGAVKEKRLPDLDDEFAIDLGLENLVALEGRVRADLERRVQEETERDLRESIVDSLLQANAFEAPESMTEQYIAAAVEDYDKTWKRIGMEPDPEKRQEFAVAARPASERAVRRALALDSLSKQHDLAVTEEEVDRWIEDKVQATGSGANEVRAFFTDVRRRRRLRAELSDDKVFEFLKGKAAITEAERRADPSSPA